MHGQRKTEKAFLITKTPDKKKQKEGNKQMININDLIKNLKECDLNKIESDRANIIKHQLEERKYQEDNFIKNLPYDEYIEPDDLQAEENYYNEFEDECWETYGKFDIN